MSGKYGFGGGLDLPMADLPKSRAVPDKAVLDEAVAAGTALGFVSREPIIKRKPGPKRKEPQDKVSIPGPKRVIDAFRAYCATRDVTLWEGLEELLDADRGRGN